MTVDEALDALLGDRRSGNTTGDLIAGAREAMRRREQNTVHGATVITGMVTAGMSYREIERATGIPKSTAQRWADPPPRAAE